MEAESDESQQGNSETQHSHLITFEAGTNESWVTDRDSQMEDTVVQMDGSTQLSPVKDKTPQKKVVKARKRTLTEQARLEILTLGMDMKAPDWMKNRPGTVHIISDEFLKRWPMDPKCSVVTQDFSSLQVLIKAIRAQQVRIQLPIVVINVKCIRQVECLEPLQNAISAVCRAVRVYSPAGRIFFTNTLPSPYSAPVLGVRASQHNELLFRAVTWVGKRMGRVFYTSMAEHFWDGKDYITPIRKYMDMEGNLTYLGCLTYRGCLFREIGITKYAL